MRPLLLETQLTTDAAAKIVFIKRQLWLVNSKVSIFLRRNVKRITSGKMSQMTKAIQSHWVHKASYEAEVSYERAAVTAQAGALRMTERMDPPLSGTKRLLSSHLTSTATEIPTPGCLSLIEYSLSLSPFLPQTYHLWSWCSTDWKPALSLQV